MSNLVKYNAACLALAEAKAVDEVKDLRDKADAMRIYAMQSKNKSLEVDAAEIRIRAERRLGEMIIVQKADGGLNTGGRPENKPVTAGDRLNSTPTLAEIGIDKNLSSRAQKMASVPTAEFEAEVGEWRDRVSAENERVTVRLGNAGDRAQAAAVAPEYFGPSDEEIALAEKAEVEQLAYIKKLLDTEDDPLSKALADVKMYRESARIANARFDGVTNEKNQYISMVKSLQSKLRKLEAAA